MNLAPQFSIVTLGVGDLDRSTAFYASLGWEQKGRLSDGIVWFRTTGTWIGLYPDRRTSPPTPVYELGLVPPETTLGIPTRPARP